MLSSHVVSCGSAICPIMRSTASVAMKLPFGVKPGRFYLRSTIWIAASHRRECGVSVLAVNKHSQASGAKSVEAGTGGAFLTAQIPTSVMVLSGRFAGLHTHEAPAIPHPGSRGFFNTPEPSSRVRAACRLGCEGIVSKRWLAVRLGSIQILDESQKSEGAGCLARGGGRLGCVRR